MEVAKAGDEQQGVEKYQADDDREQGEMPKLGNHRGAQAFAGVNERIYEHGFLQNRKFFERAPGIVRAAEENHGSDNQAEHQADVRLLHAAAEREATGRREKSYENRYEREEQRMGDVEVNTGAKQQPRGRNDHQAGSQRLQRTGDDLLDGGPGDFHGSEQAVFDLARELKFGNQRHGDGPNPGANHADGHDSREPHALIGRRNVTAADHDAAKNKHEHQRLQEGLKQQRHEVAAGDVSIAREHGEKRFPVHSRKLLPVWCRKRFSRLGSEVCTSHNSTPAPEAKAATSATSEPPRSA